MSRTPMPLADRLWPKVDTSAGPDECWPWKGGIDRYGYGRITDQRNCRSKNVKAHRRTWEISVGPIPQGVMVLHSCDNPPCCNPSHLRLGTQADNMADMAARGRSCAGSKGPHVKLTPQQVLEIRSSSELQRVIADRYGITQSNVSRIRSRDVWRGI